MSEVVIKVENIYKEYKLGTINNGTLHRDLQSWWAKLRGKEDPNSVISHHHSAEVDKESFLALNDVSFEVKRGEVLGIIGRNGAGKSTLLKILSRITAPTSGEIKIRGRIGSLLEVGTGFHPELTGRENIYMNGAILGMRKHEITDKLDEIIAFAEIEKFIDTPVKRYSSGMYVRLAFAVAAHLDPEILVVDEVLAVGDANFQKKCLGKMGDIAKEGRTVLFVSHNMGAVRSLCDRGILLEGGRVVDQGVCAKVVTDYLENEFNKGVVNNYWAFDEAPGTEYIKVKSAFIEYDDEFLTVSSPFKIVTEFWNLKDNFPVNVSCHVYDWEGNMIFNLITENKPLKKGLHRAEFFIPDSFMNNGGYIVKNMFVSNVRSHFTHDNAHSFEIADNESNRQGWHGTWSGAVRPTFLKSKYELVGEI